MANPFLFSSPSRRRAPVADARNAAGGSAYALGPRQALAQLALSGCLNATFYEDAGRQLASVLETCAQLDPVYLARTAIWARQRGGMKDMPAVLCAVLAARDGQLLEAVFGRVIDSPRLLRTFVQVVRSGVTGRRSLGSRPRRLVGEWLAARSDKALVVASVGTNPSLADILHLAHPAPASEARRALHAWLLGRVADPDHLPPIARALDAFRRDPAGEPPDLPMELLTAIPLRPDQWAQVAVHSTWQGVRQHLNTFARHRAFSDPTVVAAVSGRLRDRAAMRRGRGTVFEVLTAIHHADPAVHPTVIAALRSLLDAAIDGLPELPPRTLVCPDLSSSMLSPLTGHRPGASSRLRAVDVAATLTAMFLLKSRDCRAVPFADGVRAVPLEHASDVTQMAGMLAAAAGGGTHCAAPVEHANARRWPCDGVLIISDDQSWVGSHEGEATPLMQAWVRLRARNPAARLACLNLQPGLTSQAPNRADILNVGGWSEASLELVTRFLRGDLVADAWVREIEAVTLN